MNKTLAILILVIIVLSWNFIFSSDKKIDLTDKTKVLQSISMAIKYKLVVIEYWKKNNSLPDAEIWEREYKDYKIDVSKSLVKKIEVGKKTPGTISIYFMNKENNKVEKDINDRKVVLTPVVLDKKLTWTCTGNLYQELLPKRCKYINIEQ